MKLARAGYLSGARCGGWRWQYEDGTVASIQFAGARDTVTLDYRIRSGGEMAVGSPTRTDPLDPVPLWW